MGEIQEKNQKKAIEDTLIYIREWYSYILLVTYMK